MLHQREYSFDRHRMPRSITPMATLNRQYVNQEAALERLPTQAHVKASLDVMLIDTCVGAIIDTKSTEHEVLEFAGMLVDRGFRRHLEEALEIRAERLRSQYVGE